MIYLSLLFTICLATIHLLGYKLKFLDKIPRSGWLSFGGGVSVAYVFIHILPELSAGQDLIYEKDTWGKGFFEHHLYFVSSVGLIVFYGLERVVKLHKAQGGHEGRGQSNVFWLHIASFSIYNVLIGYTMVVRDEAGMFSLSLFTIAMGFHFLINDFGLLHEHKKIYIQKGRWFLSASVVLGWLAGIVVSLPEISVMIVFGFLSGGIVMNILKEELPDERKSRFGAFLAGALFYAALLLFSSSP